MNEADRHYRAGIEFVMQGRYQEAFEALEAAVQINPSHVEACKELARLSLQANEKRAFANWCHEAIRIDAQDPEPHLMLAEELANTGRWGEALDEVTLALQLRPLPDEAARKARTIEAMALERVSRDFTPKLRVRQAWRSGVPERA